MRLIIDTNRIISALLTDGTTREIITSETIHFYTLDYVLEEIHKYESYIQKKAKMTKKEVDLLFDLIMEQIIIVSDNHIKNHMDEAMSIMSEIDVHDSPILACALSMPNEGIWTEDKDFDKQNKITIWKNKDLIRYIKS